jgi:hypothetical protein
MVHHLTKDDVIPPDLMDEAVKNFTLSDVSRGMGNITKGVYGIFQGLQTGEYKDVMVNLAKNTGSQYVAGYTRFLDPVNQALALAVGDGKQIDRRQGNKFVNDSLRYTDQIFSFMATDKKKHTASAGEVDSPNIFKTLSLDYKEGHTPAESLFNMIGKPVYMANMRSKVPAVDDVLNKRINPMLNGKARMLLNNSVFLGLPMSEKIIKVDDMLSHVKQAVLAQMLDSSVSTDGRAARLYKMTNKYKALDINKAIKDLMMPEGTVVTDLSAGELVVLEGFLMRRKDKILEKFSR